MHIVFLYGGPWCNKDIIRERYIWWMEVHATPEIGWDDFEKIEMRVGTVLSATINEKARKPSFRIEIDFGPLGRKTSSAQLTERYTAAELIGKQIIAVVNFPVKQIAGVRSECLVLGAVDGSVVTLLTADKPVKNGLKIA